MPPRIILVLRRLRQDVAAGLSRETIEDACRQDGHHWRGRILDPATTVYLFLLQVLQPGGQRKGCGFPVAKWLALFDVSTGMLLRSTTAPLRTHDMSRAAAVSDGLAPGDVVLGDRGFCSYVHIAILIGRGLEAVFRVHQRQKVDFAPNLPRAGKKKSAPAPDDLPNSRWALARSMEDHIVTWFKPKCKPRWISKEEFASLPERIEVRVLRYRVEAPGFRVGEVALVTTLLDAEAFPAEALAELYHKRWRVEVDFRHIKTSMRMDVLRCGTAAGVLKELAVFCLAYNLARSVMLESARARGIDPDRLGLVDAVRWLIGIEGGELPPPLVVNPPPCGRVEPRVVKRRPKQYMRMTRPRGELRKLLPMKGF